MKKRILFFILFLLTIILGLLSRKFSLIFPNWLSLYLGDSLWGMMVFFGFSFLLIKQSLIKISLVSILFSYSIEFSQLYHGDWIDSIRSTTLVHLILGNTFVWIDLFSYTVGIFTGIIIYILLNKTVFFKKKDNFNI